jgi:hypothetical protein
MPSLVTSFSTTATAPPSTNSLHRNVTALEAEMAKKRSANNKKKKN